MTKTASQLHTQEEVRAMINACRSSRDRALLGMLYEGGFRIKELAIDKTAFVRKYPEFIFIFAMMLAFLYAIGAELVGLSAIVGAFIAGVSFESIELRQSKSPKEGAEYLQIIFSAVFFVSLGIIADF